MKKESKKQPTVKCWQHFNCRQKKCPAFKSKDLRCWLQCGTYCHDEIKGTWLEKMEACVKCPVFLNNFAAEDAPRTISLVADEFDSYKRRVEEKARQLEESNRALRDYKKELEKTNKKLREAGDTLQDKVEKKTKELESAQSQLIRSAKLSSLGKFSAGIAHEINNPLSGMLNCVRSLLGYPDIEGEKRSYLELILKGLLRVEDTVKRILTFSGSSSFNPAPCRVNELVEEAVSFTRHRMDEDGIRVTLDLASGLPRITAEPHQLQQVFMNIVGNALDSMPAGGSLDIETSRTGDSVEIVFSDSGCGIDKENLDNIFDPFFTTKEIGEGVGLGLSMSYTIVRQHGGDIITESSPGRGTKIKISLPFEIAGHGMKEQLKESGRGSLSDRI